MRVLVLSFYYQPDLSAGSFRAKSIVDELVNILPENSHIDVITTMPNRYSTFEDNAKEFEVSGIVSITRVKLSSHKGGMLDQSKAYLRYYNATRAYVKEKQYDIVYATSGRLFTAFLGSRIATKKKIPLYIDIRDILLDTLKDVLSRKIFIILRPVLSQVERYTFTKATKVNLVSEGFSTYFNKKYPDKDYDYFTNGIDEEFIEQTKILSMQEDDNKSKLKLILYAGNIGEGQGLHKIIPKLALRLKQSHRFAIIGDGGRLGLLKNELTERKIKNVELITPVKREKLIDLYNQADILFLHLNDYAAFERVLPSKLFEYGATGKPVLAGVAGYSAKFIADNISNSAVFSPCDDEAAVKSINELVLGHSDRSNFIDKFRRNGIMKKMAASIVSLADNK